MLHIQNYLYIHYKAFLVQPDWYGLLFLKVFNKKHQKDISQEQVLTKKFHPGSNP